MAKIIKLKHALGLDRIKLGNSLKNFGEKSLKLARIEIGLKKPRFRLDYTTIQVKNMIFGHLGKSHS